MIAESLDERLSAFAHALGNAREVAFFPKCFVWIHGSIHKVSVSDGLCGRNYQGMSFPSRN